MLAGCAATLVPGAASAAVPMPHAARTAVGTLPLLAALGIGIVVAVGAVIAFLHMTAKGRGVKDYVGWAEVGEPHFAEAEAADDLERANAEEDRERGQHAEVRSESPGEEQDLADLTIPLARADAVPLLPRGEPAQGPRLCGLEGDFSGRMFRVTGRGLMIGRDPAYCQIVFPAEAGEVSRRHCSLLYDAQSHLFFVDDHGSSNGTFLSDGRRMQPGKRYPLRSGERFSLSGDIHWFEVRD